jgi:hypothetical protein
MRHFFSSLVAVAKQHPMMFIGFIIVVVVVLGGIVWKGLSMAFGLIRKVPGVGSTVANAAEGAVNAAAAATGSK